jgi:hypothetical protein
MSIETALIQSAEGNFWLVLIAFLVISLVAGFLYMMRSIVDQNAKFNTQIVISMDKIVTDIATFQQKTCDYIDKHNGSLLAALEKHDAKASTALDKIASTEIILKSRPCIKDDR